MFSCYASRARDSSQRKLWFRLSSRSMDGPNAYNFLHIEHDVHRISLEYGMYIDSYTDIFTVYKKSEKEWVDEKERRRKKISSQ